MSVLLERLDDGVVLLTRDDPPRMNAMTADMGDALSARCDELREDTSVRVVRGTGAPRRSRPVAISGCWKNWHGAGATVGSMPWTR